MKTCQVCLKKKESFISYKGCLSLVCTDCAKLTVEQVVGIFLKREKNTKQKNTITPSAQKELFLNSLMSKEEI